MAAKPRLNGHCSGRRSRPSTRARALRPRTRAASPGELELVARFAAAVVLRDTEGVGSLLTDEAWLTMPSDPYEYQAGRRSPGSCTTAPQGAPAVHADPRATRHRLLP
jgi:hypothetical protein